MISIEITEEVGDQSAMVDLLRHIADTIENSGVRTGYYPHWKISGKGEESELFTQSFKSIINGEAQENRMG